MDSRKPKKIAACISKLPPCNAICPAGEDIQRWIFLTKKGEFLRAWETILESNPFPASHGRACYHYCESRCNRIQYDSTVNIHCIERFLGDLAIANDWKARTPKSSTGKKVLVVGAGPAGLSAAYYLRLLGHEVTIYEALSMAGGTMMFGIPAYRLPKNVLAKEIERILETEVKIVYNRRVTDILAEKKAGNFDAVFLALGAQLGNKLAININTDNLILDAIDYLRTVTFGSPPNLGRCLAVYGGGNTAIDVARTAIRFGIEKVVVIYHRSQDRMSAFHHEVADAMEEGVKFLFLRSILEFNGNSLILSVNELDDRGRPKNTGYVEEIEANSLIFALNQNPDTDFLRSVSDIDVQSNGLVKIDSFFMTGCNGVFAGGDMIPGERSMAVAVGVGKRAAYYIDAYLRDTIFTRNSGNSDPALFERLHISSDLSSFNKLNISEERSEQGLEKSLDSVERVRSFDEVLQNLSQAEILREINRCFSCGNCFGCGKCYNTCPVDGVIEYEGNYGTVTDIDGNNCIGCGRCFKVCPCGAITMVDYGSYCHCEE